MVKIKDLEVVDCYYDLDFGTKYRYDQNRIANGISDVFASVGLKIVQSGSEPFKVIRTRYNRILEQIRANKRHAKARYDNFDSEKIFFCDSEFPKLCGNLSTTTR